MVTHQLQVERRTAKGHRPKTDALPLDYATSKTDRDHEAIAKLGITYATAGHASLCTALTTIYKHGMGRGRWGLARQLQQQLVLWVCLK